MKWISSLVALFFLSVSSPFAHAQTAPQQQKNSASLLLRWIDARGNLYPGGKISRMSWVWSKLSDNDPVDSPALRLWITSKLPSDWLAKRISGDGVTIVEPFREGSTQTIAIDLRTSRATLRFEFEDRQGRRSEMTLAIRVNMARPYVLVKPDCQKNDMQIIAHKTKAQHLFVGLNCVDLGDSFDIFFFRSKDSQWNPTQGLVQFDPEGRFTAFKYHVNKPKQQVVYSQKLFRVGTLDEQRQPTEYSVFYHPKIPPKIFYASAGIGFTAFSYSEIINDIKVTQFGTTGKVNMGFRLIPRVLDIAFNGFMTLLVFSHSPSSLPSARFTGLNGRIGYRLPIDAGAVEFMFLTGLYFWSMSVADQAYGIANLTGPQLFITMINSHAGKSGWWSYIKFAMIADKFNISNLSNRELAIGGGFELSARETKPFSITLDIAHAQFTERNKPDPNGMKLFTTTLGIQKSL